jgi:hypothetical protein
MRLFVQNYKEESMKDDTPPSSLMDSTASWKVKTMEKGVGAHSLTRNTSGVGECVGVLGWD